LVSIKEFMNALMNPDWK